MGTAFALIEERIEDDFSSVTQQTYSTHYDSVNRNSLIVHLLS